MRRTFTPSNPVVLIVDDEPSLVDLHSWWLSDDYTVLTAYSGAEALEVFDDEVDIVLLDRKMPDLDGHEVLRQIRESGGSCMVAMVSAVDATGDHLEIEVDDYIQKPTDRDQLRRLVDRLLRRSVYNDRLLEYFEVISTIGSIDPNLLDHNQHVEHTELLRRKNRLRSELDQIWSTFDGEDFDMMLRSLDQPRHFQHSERGRFRSPSRNPKVQS